MQNSDTLSMTNIDPMLKFKVTESYKKIRNNLLFSIEKDGCKTIVISSCSLSEGKSTVTVNLAASLAQADYKVLLIDADLRKSKIHRFFGLTNSPGLTDTLIHANTTMEAIQSTKYANLHVLCSGSPISNPSEMLASEHMMSFLKQLQNKYDYILVNASPLNVVSDALPLIKNSDGLIIVVREYVSKRTDIDKALQSLEVIDAKLIGFILNGVHSKANEKSTSDYK